MWPIKRDLGANVADSAWPGELDLEKTSDLRADLDGLAEAECVGKLNKSHSCNSTRADTLSRPHQKEKADRGRSAWHWRTLSRPHQKEKRGAAAPRGPGER